MKKTKIICTIGPASSDYKTFKSLVQAGLNVVRINLSHATLDSMNNTLENVKRARQELNVSLPIMIDTRGPEIRVKTFKDGSITIKRGQTFTFTGRELEGDQNIVSLNEPKLVECINAGQKITAVNGLITFKVLEVKGQDVICKAINGGVISNKKSISIPGIKFNTDYLNELDKRDIKWGVEVADADYIAASFVNCKEDVIDLRSYIESLGGNMQIISKIESDYGIKHLPEIIAESDGLMVARGDLGVEVPMAKLPEYQKLIINSTRKAGKFVVTATEMLESMIYNPRATRAEISDVANACYDGTTCTMLSGESAAGKYPAGAVGTMASVCVETEKVIDHKSKFYNTPAVAKNNNEVVAHSAVNASFLNKAKAIIVYTNSGEQAKLVSNNRPACDIIAVTHSEKAYRQLQMYWGVKPVLVENFSTSPSIIAEQNGVKGNVVVVTENNINILNV